METYSTEEQEIEAVKKWWAENGLAIGLGIVIGLGGLFGWRGYQAHVAEQSAAASSIYESMLIHTRTQDIDQAKQSGNDLINNYKDTPYAIFSALILAKFAVDNDDIESARQHLDFAISNADNDQIKSLASLRLARIAFNQENYDEAIKLISSGKLKGYESAVAELKGDIYTQQGELAKAREEYALALSESQASTGNYEILEMKLDSVGNTAN